MADGDISVAQHAAREASHADGYIYCNVTVILTCTWDVTRGAPNVPCQRRKSAVQEMTNMKVTALALFALVGVIGVAFGAGYGYGGYSGGYTYMPVTGYGQQAGGFGDGSFLMLIGLLFLILILFNGNLFNTTSTSSTTPITILQG